MRVEYISHACLLIETEDLKIVTDPWFEGPAYCGQWHVFPRPVNVDKLSDVDVILISHGHEDHLHEPTLESLPKSARVFYPYSFFGGAKEFIESMGFSQVTEAVAYKTYRISPKTYLTYLLNSHDSIMVIESGGKVLINANDALHSYPREVIDFFVSEIKQKWRDIDVLFCGFGGAGYLPNTMHLDGKNDRDVGMVREQLFAHNFCHVVAGLQPKVAVPFAADFALLGENQTWINDVRFPRSKMRRYFYQYFAGDGYAPEIFDMYSGDVLEGEELRPSSPYRQAIPENGNLEQLLQEQYAKEVESDICSEVATEVEAENLAEAIRQNAKKRMGLIEPDTLNHVVFSLEIKDVNQRKFYNLSFSNGGPIVSRSDSPTKDSLLTMRLTSKILRYSLESDWGGDVINIGYGGEIFISNQRSREVELEKVCMKLLSCYPTIKGTLKQSPTRSLKFMVGNSPKYIRSLRRLKRLNIGSENYDRRVWLLKSPSEIRKMYNLPELDAEYFQ